jgi:CRISPR-associated protein Cas1
VVGKILNGRTLLRRNADAAAKGVLAELKQLADRAEEAPSEESLLGFEGSAARAYFAAFAELLAPRSGERSAFDFHARNRRPPRDPVNALLSLGYALLSKDARIALTAVGFDATVGFYHRPRHGRPALALDLMEEFRTLIVDSTVLSAINTEVVREAHFIRAAGGCALTDAGRKAFLGAYERRMDQEVTHPLFGYTLSYRRILEVQARLLSRVVTGELDRYPSFRTR